MTSSETPPMLRVAVPNKGALSQSASEMLRESGYRQRHDSKELTLLDAANGVEFFYLRPRDIALYVGEGTLDVGITGRDLLRDSGAKAEEVMNLGFGRSRFHFAGPIGRYSSLQDLDGLGPGVEEQVATGDPGVERALADVERDVARAEVEELDVVLVVDEGELLGVAALAVAGLAQDVGRGLGQRPLVGDGDAKGHADLTGAFTSVRRRRRGSGRRRA